MGQEIDQTSFSDEDYEKFTRCLKEETALVEKWESNGTLSSSPATAGFELEAWLVGADMRPAARNKQLIDAAQSDMIVPELSAFNIEFNGDPELLQGKAISKLHDNLLIQWRHAFATAESMDLKLAMIGILPTVEGEDLCLENMSDAKRYAAINEQVFKMRQGKPINLNIEGVEKLHSHHDDVMLEAATTSFQIHLKIPKSRGAEYYNASKLASIPLVAVSANSPFLFGRNLWAETRIPLFERAVSVGDWDYAERVTFGVRFIEDGLYEVFLANRQRYPVLLPQVSGRAPDKLDHLRLQNGTIWRWNRPLVGWDDDGTPHLRLEQRVVPAGPTIADSMANSAFYYGLVTYLANCETPSDKQMQFFTARDNFYKAAQFGLDARVRWDHVDDRALDELLLDKFLPMAEEGLQSLAIDNDDIGHYLAIIEKRTRSRQNGAEWQRQFVARHKADMATLLKEYLGWQQSEQPVHEWSV